MCLAPEMYYLSWKRFQSRVTGKAGPMLHRAWWLLQVTDPEGWERGRGVFSSLTACFPTLSVDVKLNYKVANKCYEQNGGGHRVLHVGQHIVLRWGAPAVVKQRLWVVRKCVSCLFGSNFISLETSINAESKQSQKLVWKDAMRGPSWSTLILTGL